MSEEEIYKMLLVEKLDKFPLLNELFAIRDSRGKRNDYTIFVNGYISLDVINKAVEKVNLLDNLKEIEQSHQEENGKLRVELEKKQNKIQALEKQHDYDMQMIDEVKGNAVKWANELEQEKEKNKDLQKQLNGAFDRGFISKDKIKERMEQTKKVYDEEMKPYMIEVGNGEKVLNVTYLSKKEKEELINKRNCLLVQIKTYEMLLEEK